MFRNLSFKVKIFTVITAIMIIAFMAVTWIVASKSVDMAKQDAFVLAQVRAEKYKNEIKTQLQGARTTAETLSSVFERRIQVVSATPPVLDKKARCGNTLALYPPQMRELCTTRTLPRKNAITFSVV